MKLLLDDEMPPALGEGLAPLIRFVIPAAEVAHRRAQFPRSAHGPNWMKAAAPEGWLVLSNHEGIQKQPHVLKAWADSGLKVVFPTASHAKRPFHERAAILLLNLHSLRDIYTDASEQRFYMIDSKIKPFNEVPAFPATTSAPPMVWPKTYP